MRTTALTHVAMSVPPGTLTAEFRGAILAFYLEAFGWKEMTSLALPERLTIRTGPSSYINVREHEEAADLRYEHFGVFVPSPDDVEDLWNIVRGLGAEPEAIASGDAGDVTFRFKHLLPMAIEVQYFPGA